MLRTAAILIRHLFPHNAKGHPRFEKQRYICSDCDSQWVAEFCDLTGVLGWRKVV
jgi:transposase-like protein